MSKPKRTTTAIIEPTVSFDGQTKKHPLQALIESDDPPEMKVIGIAPVFITSEGGDLARKDYVTFIATIKGTQVLKFEPDEPNLRAIAEEMGKIAFVNTFMQPEF